LVALLQVTSLKVALPAILGAMFVAAVLALRDPEQWAAWTFLLAVPLPMHAFLARLEPDHGGGALGIYLIAADLPLLILYLLWFRDWIRGRPTRNGRSRWFSALLVPFLLVGAVSVVYSPEPQWAMAEVIRWLKVAAVLLYVSRKLPRAHIRSCVWAIAASVLLESGISVAQMTTHSNLGLDKLEFLGAAGDQALTQEISRSESLFRGSGLSGHPNYLAGYLLLVVPIFLVDALSAERRRNRWLSAAVFGCGMAGLLATMSRAAWVSVAGASVMAFALAAGLGMLPLRRAAWVALATVLMAGAVTVGYADLVIKRFQSDFQQSWQLRQDLSRTALAIARDHPVGGVGLNNYTIVYPDYEPTFARQLIEMDGMLTVVHNVYALILAEVGFVGLCAFLVFPLGSVVLAVTRFREVESQHRGVVVGACCGIAGAMAFDLSEVSLWMDGSMYMLAFLAGLLAVCSSWRQSPHLSRVGPT
jgi:putative inorganic carbon (HCO3(-)) transporter